MQKENPFRRLAEKWPSSMVSRSEISRFTGGLMTEKYQSNLDSAGLGPPRIRSGKKIIYDVLQYLEWLEARSSVIPERGAEGHVPGKTPGQRRIE